MVHPVRSAARMMTTLLLTIVLVSTTFWPARAGASSYPTNLHWDYYTRGCLIDGDNLCELVIAWLERNGGLGVFGLPIGHMYIDERGIINLPFERLKVEFHPENAPPYDFLLSISGEQRLIQKGYIWHNAPKEQPQPGCRFFAETGYNMCGEFRSYWVSRGLEFGDPGVSEREALALFGYPITPARMEAGEDGVPRLTQWFQRARFELHDGVGVLQGRLHIETVQADGGDSLIPFVEYDLPDWTLLPGSAVAGGVYGGTKDMVGSAPSPPPPTPAPVACHPSYPDVCIPPPPPDLDCGDIPYRNFRVVGSDPHRFDRDHDGIGCES